MSGLPHPAIPLDECRVASKGDDSGQARGIATLAVRSLELELETWPKPGLVSLVDSGSHADMAAATFRRSAAAIAPYLMELAAAGRIGSAMGRLRVIGLEAEAAMLLATGGVNTHRGAIFGLGLLCAAAGARIAGLASSRATLGVIVAQRWGAGILDGPLPLHSHGAHARRSHGAGGARLEAALGFPSVYDVGLPALRHGRALRAGDEEAARVQSCFALVATLEDTNLLHRGGGGGLAFARDAAATFLRQGGVGCPDWRRRAEEVHRAFTARRLSPGGSADLLAMVIFADALETEPA